MNTHRASGISCLRQHTQALCVSPSQNLFHSELREECSEIGHIWQEKAHTHTCRHVTVRIVYLILFQLCISPRQVDLVVSDQWLDSQPMEMKFVPTLQDPFPKPARKPFVQYLVSALPTLRSSTKSTSMFCYHPGNTLTTITAALMLIIMIQM